MHESIKSLSFDSNGVLRDSTAGNARQFLYCHKSKITAEVRRKIVCRLKAIDFISHVTQYSRARLSTVAIEK